jgi:hypothetical protein
MVALSERPPGLFRWVDERGSIVRIDPAIVGDQLRAGRIGPFRHAQPDSTISLYLG